MSNYDVGDIATLRLTLRDPDTGELADGSVTVVVLHPDGSTTSPAITHPTTGIYTANLAVDAAGTWRYAFVSTGDIEAREEGVFIVKEPWSAPPPWIPTLAEVAAYVPTRTHNSLEVGQQGPLGTFTPDTTPNEEQAAALIAMSTGHVSARLGTVADSLIDAARAVAAVRAAGFIELAYPHSEVDVNTAEVLLREAAQMLTDLIDANNSAGGGSPGDAAHLLPLYSFPEPCPNLDTYPFY